MNQCGLRLKLFLFTVIFFHCLIIYAQSPNDTTAENPEKKIILSGLAVRDTTRQGVIVVRKKPITARIRVKVEYSFPKNDPHNVYVTRFSADAIVLSDTIVGIIPPQPGFLYDSNGTALPPGKKRHDTGYRNSALSFNWENYFSKMEYKFSRDDSARSDSAQFEYVITRKGKVTGKAIPWKNADSSCVNFEKRSYEWMRALTDWYPARSYREGKKRTKAVICVVIVTVYAEDPEKDQLMLLPILKSGK